MDSIRVPILGYVSPLKREPKAPPVAAPERLVVGFEGLTLDGEPFPYATVGDWIITIGDDKMATLTVNIPISLPPNPWIEEAP
jgi:hypothetical protein